MQILAGILAGILIIIIITMLSSAIKNINELKRIDYKKENNSITNIENTISPINKNECKPTMGDNINIAKKTGLNLQKDN